MKRLILKIITCFVCVVVMLLVEYSGHGNSGGSARLVDAQGLLSEQARDRLAGLLSECPANIILESLEDVDVDERFLFLQNHCDDFHDKYGMIYIAYAQKNKRVEARMGKTYDYINRSVGAAYRRKYYEIQLESVESTPAKSVENMLSHILTSICGDNERYRNQASGFLSSFVNNAFVLFSSSLPKEPSLLCDIFRVVTAPVNLLARFIGSWIVALGLYILVCATLLNFLFSWVGRKMREPGAYYAKLGVTLVWGCLCYLTWGALFTYVNVGMETLAVREACGLPDFLYCPADQFLVFTPGVWGKVFLISAALLFYVIAYLHIYVPAYLVYVSLEPRLQNKKVVDATQTWLLSYEDKLEEYYNMKCKNFDYSEPSHAENFKRKVKKGVYSMIYDSKIGRPPILLYAIIVISLITDNLFMIFGVLFFCSKGLQWWKSYQNEYRKMEQFLVHSGEVSNPDSLYNLFVCKFMAPAVMTGLILLFLVFVVLEFIL